MTEELKPGQLSEAIRRARKKADSDLGIAWWRLEEISRVELIVDELEAMNTRTPIASEDERAAITCDSDVYNHTFYGILNKQCQFWTPLAFHDEDAARAHLSKWAKGGYKSMLDTHTIVPVRIQLTAIRETIHAE